jgi:phenylalanyl-tRNA synthetase alpha chain
MSAEIQAFLKEIERFDPASKEELEAFRLKYIGKKGVMGELFSRMKDEVKTKAEEKFNIYKDRFTRHEKSDSDTDFTLPGTFVKPGSRHPISIVRKNIETIFERIGFSVSDGPEIEDDWHNFSALNFPPEHPARDMQDTFFVSRNPDIALRTHTSSVQVRVMERQKPPIRTICPGRVYRNEAISARAHCFFHQVEGLYIDEKVSFADLKQTLLYFATAMFDPDTKIRLRPSYFPFTEPSAEMDISCTLCKGKGCNVCKYTGWVEILGCGMVDPEVLKLCGIDAEKYSGYAFGMGIERIAMLKYDIKDLRLFSENDLRFLKQFRGVH